MFPPTVMILHLVILSTRYEQWHEDYWNYHHSHYHKKIVVVHLIFRLPQLLSLGFSCQRISNCSCFLLRDALMPNEKRKSSSHFWQWVPTKIKDSHLGQVFIWSWSSLSWSANSWHDVKNQYTHRSVLVLWHAHDVSCLVLIEIQMGKRHPQTDVLSNLHLGYQCIWF